MHGHTVLEQWCLFCPRRHHQPRREFDSLSVVLSYYLRCLLLSPAMQSNAGMAKQTEECRLALRANLRSHLALWSVGRLVGWLFGWLPDIRADLFASYRSGQTENCLENPEQEKWLLNRKRYSSTQAAHPFSDRICVAHLEVRCSHPYREDTGASTQVSSHCYQCT
jgi:hypothetical protein